MPPVMKPINHEGGYTGTLSESRITFSSAANEPANPWDGTGETHREATNTSALHIRLLSNNQRALEALRQEFFSTIIAETDGRRRK